MVVESVVETGLRPVFTGGFVDDDVETGLRPVSTVGLDNLYVI